MYNQTNINYISYYEYDFFFIFLYMYILNIKHYRIYIYPSQHLNYTSPFCCVWLDCSRLRRRWIKCIPWMVSAHCTLELDSGCDFDCGSWWRFGEEAFYIILFRLKWWWNWLVGVFLCLLVICLVGDVFCFVGAGPRSSPKTCLLFSSLKHRHKSG